LPLGDSDKVAVKDRVYLVGSSDPNVATSEGALERMITFNDRRYFQITAPMLSVSRGGPVFNSKEEVIGIAGESPDKQSPAVFAIPSAYLTTLLRYRNMDIPGADTDSARGIASDRVPIVPIVGPGEGGNVTGASGQDRVPSAPVDTKPVVLKSGQPRYTEEARRNQTQGVVNVRVLIGEDGEVKLTRVTKGLPDGLIEQAVAAAHEMRFKPATRNGLAVQYWLPIQVEFNLR
jgi:TonB family protein